MTKPPETRFPETRHPNWNTLIPDKVQPWKTLHSSDVLPGPYGLRQDKVLTHLGREYDYFLRPRGRGAVYALPVTPGGQLVMIRQYRYPLQRYILEMPAGAIDAGEEPIEAAARELLEEAGGVALEWIALPGYYHAPASSGSVFYPFIAFGVTLGQTQHEATELLERTLMEPAEVYTLLERGEIVDGNTSLILFHARKLLEERRFLK